MRRNGNIELLRIISMLMIVYHHYSVHSQWVFPEHFTYRQYFIELMGSFGKIGVVLFVLITGYFLKDFKWKGHKLFNIWNLVTFYSITIYLFLRYFEIIGLNAYIWQYIFPIPLSLYWFPTVYFYLYLLLPLLKVFTEAMDKVKLAKFLALFLIVTRLPYVLSLITNVNISFKLDKMALLIIFVLIGALIREYQNKLTTKYKRIVLVALVLSTFLIMIGPALINIINKTFSLNISHYVFVELASVTSITFSISLFTIFLTFKTQSKVFRSIGPATFAILLIHDNPALRDFIWVQIFKNAEHLSDPWPSFLLRSLLEPLAVFIVCMCIELTRRLLIKNIFPFRKRKLSLQ